MRLQGYATVAGLAPETDARAEAKRLGCSFLLGPNGPAALSAE
jgi:hypothetical protein